MACEHHTSFVRIMAYRLHLDITDYPETVAEATFSVTVDWGDGTTSAYLDITTLPEFVHDYVEAGQYYVVFTLTNACGTQRRRLTVEINAGYADDPLNSHIRTFPLVINETLEKADDNIPPLTFTGEVREFLLATGEYGYETAITTNVELVQFPKNYEQIPVDELLLFEDAESNMVDANTVDLHMAISDALPDVPAILYGAFSFSIVFEFRDTRPEIDIRHFNIYTVRLRGDAAFFTRCSCLDVEFGTLVDNGDGTFTSELDFEGRHLAGFQLEMLQGEEARLYQVEIDVLQEDGSISKIIANNVEIYAVSFITNKLALLDVTNPFPAVVSGQAAGEIPITSTLPIAYVEVECDEAVMLRIVYDEAKIVGGRYVLTVKNTSENPQMIRIPVSTGANGKIFRIRAYQLVQPSIENLPLVFNASINMNRVHDTYFYKQIENESVLISQDRFSSPLVAFSGTGVLQTMYGEIGFSFHD